MISSFRHFMTLSALSLVAALFSDPVAAQTGRFIIESDSDLSSIEDAIQIQGGDVVRRMSGEKGIVVHADTGLLRRLKKSNRNLKVSEDIVLMASPLATAKAAPKPAPQPAQSVPWGISAIGARTANLSSRGAGVKVCIVDTGIDKTHPDLQANIIGGRNFVVSRGRLDPSGWSDDNGHGSHVAGIVAALDNSIGVVGVAPEAKLLAMKVLDARGSGYLSDVTDGILECVRTGAHVINMSLGATSDPNVDSPLKSAVQSAVAAGVAVVVAAGNEGQNVMNTVPAGFPETIAVAAVDSNMNFPSWSNFGLSADDFSAPGVAILSTWKSGSYNTISGTSMASPHVAGVVALKISSGLSVLRATDLSRPVSIQGAGLIDAAGTVGAP